MAKRIKDYYIYKFNEGTLLTMLFSCPEGERAHFLIMTKYLFGAVITSREKFVKALTTYNGEGSIAEFLTRLGVLEFLVKGVTLYSYS